MPSSDSPSYETPLNKDELATLGELTAIIGQTEDQMVKLVAHLLKVDRTAANWIMGSSRVADNATIWSEVIRNRTKDEDVIWLVEVACREIQEISAGRNDFVHAVFQSPDYHLTMMYLSNIPPSIPLAYLPRLTPLARRVRKSKTRSVSDLPKVRNQAVYLLNLVNHIDHIMAGNAADTSPWLERLSPSLPSRPDKDAVRKATKRRVQRKS